MTDTATAVVLQGPGPGEIHEEMVFPYPIPRGGRSHSRPDLRLRELRGGAHRLPSHRRKRSWTPTASTATSESSASWASTWIASRRPGLSQTGYARVFESLGQVDGSLTIGMGVRVNKDRLRRDRRSRGAVPARPGDGPQAGRVRAHRPNAGSDAYNIESPGVCSSPTGPGA